MDTRRDFLKKVAALSGGLGLGAVPDSIARALAINPNVGSTYLDAEHVVILMQENRSFDHCYGSLQGVRGFNDPRAITLANKNIVWLQSTETGQTFAPFRLNIKDTKATWMGSLPHSWTNQVDARNGGRYDKWLEAKRPGNEEYQHIPLTLGYYTRDDLPFYYSLADAFTICDQNFCSSLTGTTPNRLYLWTGTIREKPDVSAYANVRNENVDYDKLAHWKTFPERLEEHGISWRVYQNELSLDVGFEGDEESWLANFTDNPLEWFDRYNVKFSESYRNYLPSGIRSVTDQIKSLEEKGEKMSEESAEMAAELRETLKVLQEDLKIYTAENFEKLTQADRNIHEKAFTTNRNDGNYHKLSTLKYKSDGVAREVQVPAGDVLHQFREDVKTGKLPTVSWLVAPENFSDHPGAPWYGAWYVSEVLDILTKDPEVWKKTIFILAYDENDGYFDHVPPFTFPNPKRPQQGLVSAGIDKQTEFVTLEQDKMRQKESNCRESSIGLGYRVPLVIASPWNRGAAVCSQVFDHTSILQFLETFLSQKTGKIIREENISEWRRTICGNLTSAFRPYNGEPVPLPIVLKRNEFLQSVHQAKFKSNPHGYKALSKTEIAAVNAKPRSNETLPKQEAGTRTANALPYELYVDGQLSKDANAFAITFHAAVDILGKQSAGAPFNVYASGLLENDGVNDYEASPARCYAARAGDKLTDTWSLNAFENGRYHLTVYGPNGFFREFAGNTMDPSISVSFKYEKDKRNKATGNLNLHISNAGATLITVAIKDQAYGSKALTRRIAAGKAENILIDLKLSSRWYDFIIDVDGHNHFLRRYAGKVENGETGITDPAMGQNE